MDMPLSLLNRLRRAGGFSPRVLFALNEPGVWYDPSDLTTMFQDRAGTTPVTAPGQTVGLVLDKSRGLVLGSELVTVPMPFVIFRDVSTATGLDLVASPVAGRAYKVRIVVSSNTGTVSSSFRNVSNAPLGIAAGFTGVREVILVATGAGNVTLSPDAPGVNMTISEASAREVPGAHLVANADAARGLYGIEPLGGRRNLLVSSRDPFASSVMFSKAGAGINAPTGDQYVRITELSTTGSGKRFFTQNLATVAGDMAFSFYAKENVGARWVRFRENTTTGFAFAFQPSTGTVEQFAGGASASNVLVETVAAGVYRVSCILTFASAATRNISMDITVTSTSSSIYEGDNVSGFDVTSVQLEAAAAASAYQKVVTALEVTEAGKPSLPYILFDGADDGYVTPTITPGTDKVQVFAGVRKLSDAAHAVVVDLGAPAATGFFTLQAPSVTTTNKYLYTQTGSAAVALPFVTGAQYNAPQTAIITGYGDISADANITRINGAQVASSVADQGTGNFSAAPLFVGRRNAASLPFNGRLYQLVVRFGPNLDTSRIEQVERYVNGKTGAY